MDAVLYAPIMMSDLYAAYSAPGRFYHDLNHIAECFKEFGRIKDLAHNPEAMRYAIWWHDYEYDTTKNDLENVLASALAARKAMKQLGYGEVFANAVAGLIMPTTHDPVNYPPLTLDEHFMCDIDLASLATDNFAENTEHCRKEYPHVPDETFYPARKAILKKFLERPQIYYTDPFFSLYEEKARANLIIATA